jgi:hypothetical protein
MGYATNIGNCTFYNKGFLLIVDLKEKSPQFSLEALFFV